MAFPTRNSVVWLKVETTCGTPETLTADDAMLTVGPPVIQPQLAVLPAEEQPGTLGLYGSHAGRQSSTLTLETLLRSSGSAHVPTTAPRIGRLLQACGFTETSGGTDPNGYYNYALSSDWSNHKCLSAAAFYGGGDDAGNDAVEMSTSACRGTFSFSSVAGEIPKFTFNLKGLYTATSTTTWPGTVGNFETTKPMVALDVAWTGLASQMTANTAFLEFNFDIGSEPVLGENAGTSTGVSRMFIPRREITGNLVLQANPSMIMTLETELTGRTGKALKVTFVQPDDSDEHFVVYFASLKWGNPYELGDKDGIRVLNMPFTGDESSGDDEIELQFGYDTVA